MLRPALCLLSAGAAGARDLDRFVTLGTSMELLHLAALAHDDVLDSSDYRHGASSLNARWDNHAAVLGGDYLVARAVSLLAVYNSVDIVVSAMDSVRLMAEGELANFGLGPDHFSEEACIHWARHKTASLFAAACSTPTYLVGPEHREALYEFGMGLGIAFQLIDDVLDLCQDRDTLGKPSCGDIVEGKKTLPILYMREGLDAAEKTRLDGLRGRPIGDEDREWIVTQMERTGARERTESRAREYIEGARAHLATLPATPYRDAAYGITEFVLVRGS